MILLRRAIFGVPYHGYEIVKTAIFVTVKLTGLQIPRYNQLEVP